YHLDACSQAATAFIDRHKDQPFFLYLAYRAPHVPLDAPEKYLARFPGDMPERRRQALAMISAMDDGVGQIVERLAQLSLTERTLIFFIGDNGAPLKIAKEDAPGRGAGWDGSLNEPMNGEKGMLAEGGIRVPFLISWPGTIPGNQVSPMPMTALDVAATTLPLASINLRPHELDGIDLLPYLRDPSKPAPERLLTWRWIAQAAVRHHHWKLLKGGEREYLFDLSKDPGEAKNLLSTHPEIANRLRSHLNEWSQELQPPGLATGLMSSTWERYFDHYLEGKPGEVAAKPSSSKTWIARNANLSVVDQTLVVKGTGRRPPFLALSKIKLTEETAVTIQSSGTKTIRLSWRCQDQKDFDGDQSVSHSVEGSGRAHLTLPKTTSPIIHLRLHLDPGDTEIRQVSVGTQTWTW
ncbi:MAG: sulfatase-like hydrolase/transferase, partial [Verrucomicrobiota bacterium]